MINELLRPKYNKTSFYCHNLAGYDIVFILKILCTYNEENSDKYTIRPILRNDRIIKVTISKDKHSFSIMDSYAMLPDSLQTLGVNFEVDTVKSKFPYKFAATQNNLFYAPPDRGGREIAQTYRSMVVYLMKSTKIF